MQRPTLDLDVLDVIPLQAGDRIMELAGRYSPLRRGKELYIDRVTVAAYPDSYDSRLIRVFAGLKKLRLWALEAHDLALTKLERSINRDVGDVVYLANAGFIQRDTLVKRFHDEMRPYMMGRTPDWHDTTLRPWIEECWPDSK